MTICNFSGSEDPIALVRDCLHTFAEIDNEIKAGKRPVFDLSGCTWIFPCTAILLSNKITALRNKGIDAIIIPPRNMNAQAYLGVIGFPQGRAITARTYSPIHHYSKNSEKGIAVILDKIEKEFPVDSITPIKYILSELGGSNIEEHSQYTLATIMAQFYEKKGFIDIGIFDNGITIPRKFEMGKIVFNSKSPRVLNKLGDLLTSKSPIQSSKTSAICYNNEDGQAIYMAMNGKSTKEVEGGRGFGLSTSQKLVLQGLKGSFYLFSRKGIVEIDHKTPQHKIYKYQNEILPGTLIYIRFNTPSKKIQMEKYYG